MLLVIIIWAGLLERLRAKQPKHVETDRRTKSHGYFYGEKELFEGFDRNDILSDIYFENSLIAKTTVKAFLLPAVNFLDLLKENYFVPKSLRSQEVKTMDNIFGDDLFNEIRWHGVFKFLHEQAKFICCESLSGSIKPDIPPADGSTRVF